MNDAPINSRLIEINYFAEGKFVGVTHAAVYPNIREGDTIELQLEPTPRDLRRTPNKIQNRFYVVERVHHIVEERPGSDKYLDMKVDVMLRVPEPIEEDDTRSLSEILKDQRKHKRRVEQN